MGNNLALAQVAPSQNNKETTIDDQAGQLDAGLTDKIDVSLTDTTSPLLLSDAQALRWMVLKLTGTHPGGAYEVHCPTSKEIYVVWNSAAGDVTFKPVAGTGTWSTPGPSRSSIAAGLTSSSWRVWSPRSTTSAMC